MNLREFFAARWEAETPAFVKVLQAMPEGQGGYRPHERSRSAAELAWVLAKEAEAALSLVKQGKCDWVETPPPARLQEIVDTYAAASSGIAAALKKADDAAWMRPAQFMMGGHVAFEQPLGEMLWFLLFDAVHHRGQLSTYLRPMGGKVPSIYGPSGDDPGGM